MIFAGLEGPDACKTLLPILHVLHEKITQIVWLVSCCSVVLASSWMIYVASSDIAEHTIPCCLCQLRARAAVSTTSGSAASVPTTHSLPGSAAVRCISVLQNAVICACNDGQVIRIPLSVPWPSDFVHPVSFIRSIHLNKIYHHMFIMCLKNLFKCPNSVFKSLSSRNYLKTDEVFETS